MNPLDPTAAPSEAARASSDETTALPAETPRPNVDTTVAHAPAAPLAAPYHEGSVIGRYQVRRLLGEGAFGRVYACWDDKLAREVAVKVPKRRMADGEQLAAFLREAQAAARLRHSGIVQVFDVGQLTDGTPFVVMEVVAGESLADRRVADPVVTMWISNVVFLAAGIILSARMSRASVNTRGETAMDMLRETVRRIFRRKRRRLTPAAASASAVE